MLRLTSLLRTTTAQSRGGVALLCGGATAAAAAALAKPALAKPACCEAKPAHCEAKSAPALFLAAPAEATAKPTMEQRLIAEAIGTGIIVQLGCGAVCALKYAGGNFGTFGLAAAWGVAVALAVYTTRGISGAHLNPAVTTALTAIGLFPQDEAPLFIGAQVLGATIAGAANYLIFSSGIAASEAAASIVRGSAASTASFAGAFGMVPNAALMGPAGAFVAEVWMTSILMYLILAIGDAPHDSVPGAAAPALVGASVSCLICVFGPVTGCGMNPARDLGPRLVTLLTGWGSAALTAGWVYTLGPVVGATCGAFAYKATLASEVTK